jgi:hypothetical protein
LNDWECASAWAREAWCELAGELLEASECLRSQVVVDERRRPFRSNPAALPEHLQMMAHGWLGNVAASGEITGANSAAVGELTQDGEAGWVGRALQEEYIGVCRAFHSGTVLTDVNIVKYQYASNNDGVAITCRLES